jgi:hypothetical protein
MAAGSADGVVRVLSSPPGQEGWGGCSSNPHPKAARCLTHIEQLNASNPREIIQIDKSYRTEKIARYSIAAFRLS